MSSNPTDSAYPSSLSKDPTTQPAPSTSQELPPNNDAAMADHENRTNPTKNSGDASVSKGTASVGPSGNHPDEKSAGGEVK